MKYSEKKTLSTSFAAFGVVAMMLGSTTDLYAMADIVVDSMIDDPYRTVIQTNYNGLVPYDVSQQSTQVDTIINNDQDAFLSYLLKEEIIEKIEGMFGYDVVDIDEDILVDDEERFTVYTAMLELKDRDYSKLLDEEWKLSESLGLYDKNIILRFL